jgi:hypothetical protein
MRFVLTTVLLALATTASAGDLRSTEAAFDAFDETEQVCVLTVDAEGYEVIACGEPVDVGGSTEQITPRDCARQGGTLSQPYLSQGDSGWYCTGLFLGAPPTIR